MTNILRKAVTENVFLYKYSQKFWVISFNKNGIYQCPPLR